MRSVRVCIHCAFSYAIGFIEQPFYLQLKLYLINLSTCLVFKSPDGRAMFKQLSNQTEILLKLLVHLVNETRVIF